MTGQRGRRIAINRFFGATKDADRIKNESITEKEDTVGGPDEPDGGSGETSALVHVPTVPSFSGDGEVEDYSFAMG